jgi:hypothetical protein
VAKTRKNVEQSEEVITPSETVEEKSFFKEDVLRSKEFSPIERDFLSGFLEDKKYTIDEARKALEKIKKGVVK